MSNKQQLTLMELDRIMQQCIAEEYTAFFSVCPRGENPIHVSLEKGSTYGNMHMKFSAEGKTVQEAFQKCLDNFPKNPIGALWDTKRIEHVHDKTAHDVVDGSFTELDDHVQPPSPSPTPIVALPDDEVPF